MPSIDQAPVENSSTRVFGTAAARTTPLGSTARVVTWITRLAGSPTTGGLGAIPEATSSPA